jgi:aspartyl-tRNA(Asn)/glutamyl-tRNA(Gln) amidotransferase subunit B
MEDIIKEVIEENTDAVEDYMNGEEEAINYLVARVMERSGGKYNPGKANDELKSALEDRDKISYLL